MTIEKLQSEMIAAMKSGDRFRKGVISVVIARVKNTAIDSGCRDNIPEVMVDAELLKAKKITQEMIDTCPESRADLLEDYKKQMEVINEFVPQPIIDPVEIMNIVKSASDTILTKKEYMKFFNMNYRGKVDMKVASEAVDYYIDYNCNAKVVPQ